MKKSYLIMAAAAALFAACSSNDDAVTAQQPSEQSVGEVAIGFDTYVDRGTTRAGVYSSINDASALQGVTDGFGVFAYYTNSDTYDPIFQPNFMYNQQVKYSESKWSYTPVKYWPNEFTSANAEENDKVSFFAYAPYVKATASTGKVAGDATNYSDGVGIVGFSRNTATGDPLVKYVANFNTTKQVDLLWGVCPQTTWDIKNSLMQTMTVGLPWLNIQHPRNLTQNLTFNFKHALASLNVDVDLYANATTATAAAAGTKVYIRSVTFTGFATKGTLNLNNTVANTPLWLSYDGLSDIESGQEITILDGRKDSKEGLFAANNETQNINSALVQSTIWGAGGETAGVTNTATNLFYGASANTDPIYVIPTGDNLKVTIVYDVLTADSNLPGYLNDGTTHGSVVQNTITKEIKTGGETGSNIVLEGLKKYTVHLHIGLQEVTVDATVTSWGDAIAGSGNLPVNTTNP